MATKKNEQTKPAVTRAAKKDGVKKIVREILEKSNVKAGELIDEAAKLYAEAFGGEDTENPNDVKGRIGSVIDVMKKDGEIVIDGGVYALKVEKPVEEKPKKATRTRAKKVAEEEVEEQAEKPKKRATKKAKEAEKQPLPPAPLQPIAPTVPVTPEIAPEPIPEDKPKKRGRKAKAEVKEAVAPAVVEEKPVPQTEEKPAPQAEEQPQKAEEDASPKGTLMDMSFLLGAVKPQKKEEKPAPVQAETKLPEVKKEEKAVEVKKEVKKTELPVEVKTGEKKAETKVQPKSANNARRVNNRPLTADERLQDAFLSRLRRLGGDYFEYYSVYLLERYSRMNGRRLESLKITGGDHDGGIDGEIELTDRLGFRETIYIQAKNWDPDKGDEKLWVVGETLLQQFIGACVCRQAKEGKQHCRGIFITTSRFTPEAKRILEETSDKFVGYDGSDLFEAAKECQYGLVKKNGQWVLDDELLSGEKAFFNTL